MQFWVVWNENRQPPMVKHWDEAVARKEAERLARSEPGAVFHVLTLVDTCRRNDVIWESDREIPF